MEGGRKGDRRGDREKLFLYIVIRVICNNYSSCLCVPSFLAVAVWYPSLIATKQRAVVLEADILFLSKLITDHKITRKKVPTFAIHKNCYCGPVNPYGKIHSYVVGHMP